MELKTVSNIARSVIDKGYIKKDLESDDSAVTAIHFRFRACPYQRPSSNSSEKRTREI
jgi:hypothetical protein